MGFLAYVPSFKGEKAVVLNCDSSELAYLRSKLTDARRQAQLGSAVALTIGDHPPILADNLISIEIRIDPKTQTSGSSYRAKNSLIFDLTLQTAEEVTEKLTGMINFGGPCHQFFSFPKCEITLVITMGEYSNETLRKMRSELS